MPRGGIRWINGTRSVLQTFFPWEASCKCSQERKKKCPKTIKKMICKCGHASDAGDQRHLRAPPRSGAAPPRPPPPCEGGPPTAPVAPTPSRHRRPRDPAPTSPHGTAASPGARVNTNRGATLHQCRMAFLEMPFLEIKCDANSEKVKFVITAQFSSRLCESRRLGV